MLWCAAFLLSFVVDYCVLCLLLLILWLVLMGVVFVCC